MGIGWTEIVVVLIVALVFLGPSRFPAAARKLGSYYREFRDALGTMERDFEKAVDADESPDQAQPAPPAVQTEEEAQKPATEVEKPR